MLEHEHSSIQDKAPQVEEVGKDAVTVVDLQTEIGTPAELNQRSEDYIKLFSEADHIVVMIGCDDARVGVPGELVDGTLYVYVPKIGGGAPDKELLSRTLEGIRLMVPDKPLSILSTQHADHDELAGEAGCTCGLRGVFASQEEQFKSIGDLIRSEVDAGRNTFEDILAANAEVAAFITEVHEATGFPKRLIFVAARDNFASDYQANRDAAVGRITETLKNTPFADIEVRGGVYNHQDKKVQIAQSPELVTEIAFDQLPKLERGVKHQDPSLIVVSFGARAVLLHDGVVLPQSVGLTSVGNDFSTVAVTEQEFKEALAEAWYAAHNHHEDVHGHPHGGNFAHLQGCVIICDSDTEVSLAQNFIASPEFTQEYGEDYADLEKIRIINLQSGQVSEELIPASGNAQTQ